MSYQPLDEPAASYTTTMKQNAPKIPKLPENFLHLIDNYDPNKYLHEYIVDEYCDCQKEKQPFSKCPHMKDEQLRLLFSELPFKLGHIDHVKAHNRDELRLELFKQIVKLLEKSNCQHDFFENTTIDVEELQDNMPLVTKQERTDSSQCHIYRDLKRFFPSEYKQHFSLEKKKKRVREARLLISGSFGLNIFLMILKVVAIFFSNSMSVLTSMMDTALDVLSGFILILAVFVAKKGIKQGGFGRALHQNTAGITFLYALRFETLGILAFACIMGTIAAVLIGESAQNIGGISSGNAEEMTLNVYTIVVMSFNIGVKILMSIWCWLASKRTDESREVLEAYRDDHRNDVMSNSIGLAGALLAKYLGGAWAYCDPGAAIVLSVYIFYNWASTALQNVKSLAGKQLSQAEQDAHMLRMLYLFDSSELITKVLTFVVYESGNNCNLEIRIEVPNQLPVDKVHAIVEEIQKGFETAEGIERCYVHVESEVCGGAE